MKRDIDILDMVLKLILTKVYSIKKFWQEVKYGRLNGQVQVLFTYVIFSNEKRHRYGIQNLKFQN